MSERKLLITRKQAAEEAGVSKYEMEKLCAAGAIRTLRVGRNIRVHRASLEAFIAGDLSAASA